MPGGCTGWSLSVPSLPAPCGSIPPRSSPPFPQSPEQVQAVGRLSYNQLVEKIITCKQASDSSLVSEGNAPGPSRDPRGHSWARPAPPRPRCPRCPRRAGGRAVPGVHGIAADVPWAVRAHGPGPRGRARRLLPQQPLQHHDQAQGAAPDPAGHPRTPASADCPLSLLPRATFTCW